MIKDKNIDPTSKFANATAVFAASVTATTTTTWSGAWIAPYAGCITSCSIYASANTAAGAVSIFSGVVTNAGTLMTAGVVPTALTAVEGIASFATTTFTSGAILTLRSTGTIDGLVVNMGVRPLLAKELSGY